MILRPPKRVKGPNFNEGALVKALKLAYGDSAFALDIQSLDIIDIVQANHIDLPKLTPAEAVRKALANPIASPPLADIVRPGEKICLIAPDITRLWQSPATSLPIILDELNKAGINDEDITLLCACGTHRQMTPEEHEKLLGSEIVKRLKVVDHNCLDKSEMRHLGQTTRGTPVWLNRKAVEADKIITVCGVVYHFLAGFGGGGKMLLPGIAANETIQANHELALMPGFGNGYNPEARSGNNTESNPFHADIFEAASFLAPAFSLNVVVDSKFNIIKAFAGDWKKAHAEACKLVAAMEGVAIPTRADLVIASAGGAPKDINIYQGVKLIANALEAANPGASILLLMQCPEGFGNEDTKRLVCDFKTMQAREKALRDNFSIGEFAGYYLANAAECYELILVTDMKAEDFANTKIRVAKTLDEGIALAKDKLKTPCILMPHGASTLPMLKK